MEHPNNDPNRPQTSLNAQEGQFAPTQQYSQRALTQIYNLKGSGDGGVKPASYINAIPRINRKPRNPLKTINYYDYQP